MTETTVPEKRITDAIALPQLNIGAIDLPDRALSMTMPPPYRASIKDTLTRSKA